MSNQLQTSDDWMDLLKGRLIDARNKCFEADRGKYELVEEFEDLMHDVDCQLRMLCKRGQTLIKRADKVISNSLLDRNVRPIS